jgi:tetratricopeptide (TPR) repeat protein
MIFCARILLVGLTLAVGVAPAVADDELLKTQPFPEQPAPAPTPAPNLPKQAPSPPPATPSPDAAAQSGEPGMMGMPWPKTPEEARKTLDNLYAFLATTGDHREAGEISGAIERLWRLSGGDTVNLLIDRAELFSSKNESEKALPLLDAAVDLAPDYAEAWSHRGYVEYRLNNYPAALGDLRRAIALDPNHFRALDGMAKILTLMG